MNRLLFIKWLDTQCSLILTHPSFLQLTECLPLLLSPQIFLLLVQWQVRWGLRIIRICWALQQTLYRVTLLSIDSYSSDMLSVLTILESYLFKVYWKLHIVLRCHWSNYKFNIKVVGDAIFVIVGLSFPKTFVGFWQVFRAPKMFGKKEKLNPI